jgi:hypothetical protein
MLLRNVSVTAVAAMLLLRVDSAARAYFATAIYLRQKSNTKGSDGTASE